MKDKEQLAGTKPGKKTYHQPELQVYGDLREITQTLGTKGVDDKLTMITKTSL